MPLSFDKNEVADVAAVVAAAVVDAKSVTFSRSVHSVYMKTHASIVAEWS
jgi:hypothetical protein